MSEDSKAMFQSKNFTLPDGWVLNEPQRSFNGGFGTAGIKKIIDHTRKMFQNVPGMISYCKAILVTSRILRFFSS